MARKEKAPKAPKEKKPIHRRWWFWVVMVIFVIPVCLSLLADALGLLDTDAPTVTSAPVVATEAPSAAPLADPDPTEEPVPTFNLALGKDIAAYFVSFNRYVNNDKTGNWRVAQFAEAIDFTEYALSYYQEFFESDSEVHFVINRTYGTTTRLNAASGFLFVSTYENVDGEEHDANKLPSGMLLGQWTIDTATGEIEEVTDAE